MIFLFLISFFLISFTLYLAYSSYIFQIFLHRRKLKHGFVDDFVDKVKGQFLPYGHFAISHKIISSEKYASLNHRDKTHFSKCYNVVTFATEDAHWELFFHLVKEGMSYSEILTLRVFPKHVRIRSEGNVEKNYSRLNIFTNNRYLTGVLEQHSTQDYLKWLIRQNQDILLISHSNLHFKAFLNSEKITSKRVLDMVRALHELKNKIYKKDVLEY